MQSDKKYNAAAPADKLSEFEEQDDKTLEWLLDQDYSDQQDRVFSVSDDEPADLGLTEYETQVANRHMLGGDSSADDLSSFVDEEIVMTAPGQNTDIYAAKSVAEPSAPTASVENRNHMAIDHSRSKARNDQAGSALLDDGFDFLGLNDDDDIGDRFVLLQKSSSNRPAATPGSIVEQNIEVEQSLDLEVELDLKPGLELEATAVEALADTAFTESDLSLDLETLEVEPAAASPLTEDAVTIDASIDFDSIEFSEFTEANEEGLEADLQELAAAELELASDFDDLEMSDTDFVPTEVAAETFLLDGFLSAPEVKASEPFLSDMPVFDGSAMLDGSVVAVTDEAEITPTLSAITEEFSQIESGHAQEFSAPLVEPQQPQWSEPTESASFDMTEILGSEHIVETKEKNSANLVDVYDYVAANEPPTDDEDFDQYLLAGEHFGEAVADDENLEVERTQGVASVDPQLDVGIDYHQDFTEAHGLSLEVVTAVTAVIADIMEDLSQAVNDRLMTLGSSATIIEIDAMVAGDASSAAQYIADNYLPILELGGVTPAALPRLGQTEIDAIYVRLSNSEDGSNWNRMFNDTFGVVLDAGQSGSEVEPEAEDIFGTLSDFDELAEVAVQPDELSGAEEDGAIDALVASEVSIAEVSFEEGGFDDDVLFATALTDTEATLDAAVVDDGIDAAIEESVLIDSAEPELAEPAAADDFDEDIFGDLADFDLSPEAELALGDTPVFDSERILGGETTATINDVFDETVFLSEVEEQALPAIEPEAAQASEVETAFDNTAQAPQPIQSIADETAAEELAVPAIAAKVQTQSDTGLAWCVPADIQFSYASQNAGEIFTDFLNAFLEEGMAELEKLESAIAEWEKDFTSESAYAPIPRSLHTLKGIAKGVGLQRYGTLIHNFETLLEKLPRPAQGQEDAFFRTVNAWLDAALTGLEQVEASRGDIASELPGVSTAPVAAVINEAITNAAPVAQRAVAKRQEEKKDQALADEGAKALSAQQTIRMTPEALDRLLSLTNEARQLGVRSSQSTFRSKRAAAELLTRLSSVRAHVSKIAERALMNVTARGSQAASEMDALEMDQYSELQEAANILREGVEDLDDLIHLSSRQNTISEALLKQQSAVISSLGSAIQTARVIPVSRLMPGLRRIVRNLGTDLGKVVAFKVMNEVGTLDRDSHARCQVILEHMVRNALDHGIELPNARVAAGKEAQGRITIDASKKGSDYIITLTDDGKGIDPEVMRDRAYEKGLDIDVDAMSDEEAIRLIFHKGLSTATEISEISGRGVGMDIVLSEVQQIGGDIRVESTVGVGTTFRIKIPSNMTVNGALLVAAGEVSYAIPLDGLIAVDHVQIDKFYEALESKSKLTLYGMECDPGYLATMCHGEAIPERSSWGSTVPVIVAGTEKRYMAIAIDNLEEALELVIRSLGAQFATIPGLAGGATTADGKSIVALDLNALVASLARDEEVAVSLRTEREERMLVLVVDDSRTQRMVATSQFDTLGVETVTAENGLVAIDLLNATHRLPDVILLDIEMPVKDGIQTLREIRKSTRYRNIPVIMVTSRTGAKHRALAQEAGCNGYMGKPFNFPKLIDQITLLTSDRFQLS